tara:strand:- start:9067 stop:10128 length:1062 start_codon:yes stop_codon:yes gene_type:complete
MSVKVEYVWLDGHSTPNLRSKSRFFSHPIREIEDIPCWGFDGSSTEQAIGSDSDCVLRPVRLYNNPIEEYHSESYIVLCEVDNVDGTPHESNFRRKLQNILQETEQYDMLFGIEQEYVFVDSVSGRVAGWPSDSNTYPRPQGEYYCGVGANANSYEDIVNQHAKVLVDMDISLHGINAEVMLGQWEYQLGTRDAIDICDELWISRFMLYKVASRFGMYPEFHPKPVQGDWNGSGAHINFSTLGMRESWELPDFHKFCEVFGEYSKEMVESYGEHNDLRLTGKHETAHINDYSYGVSDRGCSIRIPYVTVATGKGYLEDRRPASNIDPYRAVGSLVQCTTKCERKIIEVDYKVV